MNNLLHKLWAEKEKNTVILDSSGNIVYSSRVCSCEPEKIRDKAKLMPDGIDETEFFDLNVRIYKSIITDGGEEYICCTFDDISEYTSLVKEISEYTKTLSDVA